MKSVVKSAKTVDEAIKQALEELQVSEEYVDVQVIEKPTRGFLGLLGTKPAIIRVSVNKTPADTLLKFLTDVCHEISSDFEIKIESQTDEVINVSIQGENLGLIVGRRGETLNSLQYLANIVYNKNLSQYCRVIVNAGDYRERREKTIIRLGMRLSEKVVENGRKIALEPMNAYERRILHTALQDVKGITTYSEGQEPYRHVVIAPNRGHHH